LRIAPGFIGEDGDEVVAVRIFAFDVPERRPDGAGKLAALDVVAAQAIALAAIESKPLSFGSERLRAGWASGGADQPSRRERESKTGLQAIVGQRRFRLH